MKRATRRSSLTVSLTLAPNLIPNLNLHLTPSLSASLAYLELVGLRRSLASASSHKLTGSGSHQTSVNAGPDRKSGDFRYATSQRGNESFRGVWLLPPLGFLLPLLNRNCHLVH